jgi:shikimate kinase
MNKNFTISNNLNTPPIGKEKLFLIGMMGAGKSFFGKQIAKKLQLNFFDLDTVIEQEQQQTITEIFETKTEGLFRQIEANCLHTFNQKVNFVLATGGGTPCFYNNMQWMNEQGTTIWINESIDILVERLRKEKNHRPLVASLSDVDLKFFLENKLIERKPFYSQAKIILDAGDISLEQIIQHIHQLNSYNA